MKTESFHNLNQLAGGRDGNWYIVSNLYGRFVGRLSNAAELSAACTKTFIVPLMSPRFKSHRGESGTHLKVRSHYKQNSIRVSLPSVCLPRQVDDY